jgi:hypothetical protein
MSAPSRTIVLTFIDNILADVCGGTMVDVCDIASQRTLDLVRLGDGTLVDSTSDVARRARGSVINTRCGRVHQIKTDSSTMDIKSLNAPTR